MALTAKQERFIKDKFCFYSWPCSQCHKETECHEEAMADIREGMKEE